MRVKISRFDREIMDLTKVSNQIHSILTTDYEQSPWSKNYILADLQSESSEYFLAEINETLIGFLALTKIMDEIEITNLAIHKEFQRHGIAMRLLSELSDFRGNIFLEVRQSNLAAQTLYKKFEFEVYHKRKNYYDYPCEDAILMRKILD